MTSHLEIDSNFIKELEKFSSRFKKVFSKTTVDILLKAL